MNWLDRAGAWITGKVSNMWCAIIFLIISLVSLPAALYSGDAFIIVSWISQSFLQLVLLPIIMVGQRVSTAQEVAPLHEHHARHQVKLDEILEHVHGLRDKVHKVETEQRHQEYRRNFGG